MHTIQSTRFHNAAAHQAGWQPRTSNTPVSSDIVFIGTFGTTATALTPAPLRVTDPALLDHLRTLPARVERGGSTNLTAGLDLAIGFLTTQPLPLKKLVVIGDGEANADADKIDDRALALRQHRITARCIDVGAGAGKITLEKIALMTVKGEYAAAKSYASLVAFLHGKRPNHGGQTRTAAVAMLIDVSPSMTSAFLDEPITRIVAAQRAAAQFISMQAKLFGGKQ